MNGLTKQFTDYLNFMNENIQKEKLKTLQH